jgi:hypothetical protein
MFDISQRRFGDELERLATRVEKLARRSRRHRPLDGR